MAYHEIVEQRTVARASWPAAIAPLLTLSLLLTGASGLI
jgi:hypothetical protein